MFFRRLLFLAWILPSVSQLFFADDTIPLSCDKGLEDLIHQINEEIAKIYAWVNAHIDQTSFILFRLRNSSRCIDYIIIKETRIAQVTTTKFRGVMFDDKLKWSTHILHIWKNARGIGILLRHVLMMKHSWHCITPLCTLILAMLHIGGTERIIHTLLIL